MVSSATAAATAASSGTGARNTSRRTIGIRTTAVAMRFSKVGELFVRLRMYFSVRVPVPVVQSTVAPLALLVLCNAFEQLQAAEIRPQRWRDINLGISQLPQQKIAQPHLAAGAYHQIRVRQGPRVKMAADRLFVNVQMLNAPVLRRSVNHGTECVTQFSPGAVVKR